MDEYHASTPPPPPPPPGYATHTLTYKLQHRRHWTQCIYEIFFFSVCLISNRQHVYILYVVARYIHVNTSANVIRYTVDVSLFAGTYFHGRPTPNQQGNQRWQIPRPATCLCLARFTPLKSKILTLFRDVISLLARVFILLIDTATQEVTMKKHLKEIVSSFF